MALVACLVLFCLGSTSSGQSSADVHTVPGSHTLGNNSGGDAGVERTSSVLDMRRGKLSVQVDLVLVPVTVTDSMNRPVTGLSKENFAVYEDDRPQQIRYFSTEDAPISVGILFDVSGTMKNKIDDAREALADFFKNSHPDDDYFVITFADRPQLLADSTRSRATIQASLATVKPFGYTSLLDAVHMGLMKLQSARYRRRALLIISDGGDNYSRYSLREIKEEVEESDVEVYAIGLFDDGLPVFKSLDEKLGKRVLSTVTEASGGRAITVGNLARLPEVAAAISLEMRSQYLLGYRSTNPVRDGKWRKIKVRIASAPADSGDTVRLRAAYKKGYTAPLY